MSTELGDYLRARRADVSPAEAGLPTGARRRVPGLRRSEVAVLAEISVEYYVRLEQGRERGPSPAVLDALASALRLSRDGHEHLYRLAGLAPVPTTAGPERVDQRLAGLLQAWTGTPALVLGRALDVLAANPVATELFSGFRTTRNLVEFVFLDPTARDLYPDWDVVARNTLAALRLADGAHPGDPRIAGVRERLAGSEEFLRAWDRHDARGKTAELKRFAHPQAGDLTLHVQTFDVREPAGQQLAVYHADPATPSADGLALLGILAAQRSRETTAG